MSSLYYNGQENIKAVGVPISYSESELDEYIKCKQDPIYFIRKYCLIVSLDKGLVPFDLFGYQERFIRAMHDGRRVISKQPRQMGKTQTAAAYIVWYTLFNDVKTVAILANKSAVAREIMSRYKLMYEHLPAFIQQGVKVWNKGDVELENGSKVFTAATSASGIRSKSVNFLYIDECAIIQNTVADEFFTSTYPVISAGQTTKIVLTSTPLGYNHFWKFWNEAVNGINGFEAIEVHYNEHPDRDEAWSNQQRQLLGDLKWRQEICATFLGSSDTLIDAHYVSTLPVNKPIFQKDNLDIYEKPIKGNKELGTKDHSYVIVVDTSKGVGGDYSAFTIIDVSALPYQIVGKYRNNKIPPMLFPSVIHKVASDYNMAWLLFETNASEQVPHIIYYELEYENLLFVSRSSKRGQEVSIGFGGAKLQLGVQTDKKIKRIGCSNIKSIVEEGKLVINDIDVIAEMTTFIAVKDSYEADDGYHDDLVMTLVLFGWLTTQSYFKDLVDVDLRKNIYQAREDIINTEQLPSGWFTDGTEKEEPELFNF